MSTSLTHTSDKLLTYSNAISFFRVLLAIPTVLTFLSGDWAITGSCMVLAYLTDILDGYVARKTNTVSEWGKIIDPTADKLYVAAVILAMVSKGMVPLWFVLIVIGKDVLTMIGALAVRSKTTVVPPSNYWGKGAILLTIICLFLAVCGLSSDILLFGWIASAIALLTSFVVYIARSGFLFKPDSAR